MSSFIDVMRDIQLPQALKLGRLVEIKDALEYTLKQKEANSHNCQQQNIHPIKVITERP